MSTTSPRNWPYVSRPGARSPERTSARVHILKDATAGRSTMAKMLINGELVEAQSGQTLQVRNPANGEVVGDIPRGGKADVDAAVAAAAKAFPVWAATPPSKRAAMMHEAARKMRE